MVIDQGAFTLRDVAARMDRSGEKFNSDMINLVYETNPLLQDLPVVEANDGSSNITTYRVALPEAKFTGYREGVKPSKGGVTSVRNTAAHMDAIIEMSQREWDEAPDKNAFLADAALDQIEAMNQKQSREMIYGSLAANVRGYNGFFAHQSECGAGFDSKGAFANKVTDDKKPEYYIFNGYFTGATTGETPYAGALTGGDATSDSTGDLRSIGLVGVGTRTVRGFYPRGTTGGIKKGKWNEHQMLQDGNGGKYEGCSQFLSWDFGLDIRDWRYAGWIRNIKLGALETRGAEMHVKEMLRRLSTRVGGGKQDGAKWQWVMSLPVFESLQTIFERLTMANAITYQQIQDVLQPVLWGKRVVIMDCMNRDEEALPMKA